MKKDLISPHRYTSVHFITEISYKKIPINELYSYKIDLYIYKIIVSQYFQRIFLVFLLEICYTVLQIYILYMKMLLIIYNTHKIIDFNFSYMSIEHGIWHNTRDSGVLLVVL